MGKIASCGQYDGKSDISAQRQPCSGEVHRIEYEQYKLGVMVLRGTMDVCDGHLPSWRSRDLEKRGYRFLGIPPLVGEIGRSVGPEMLS